MGRHCLFFFEGVASCKSGSRWSCRKWVFVSIRCLEGRGPIRGETKAGALCGNIFSQHRFSKQNALEMRHSELVGGIELLGE